MSCASSTSGCSAACRSPRAAPSCRPRSPTSPATRSTREFDDDALRRAGSGAARPGIKRLLLDQTLVSGVGNIYADEALWRAQAPRRPAGRAAPPVEVRRAARRGPGGDGRGARAGRHVSFDALYVNVNGESGYFDRSLHAYGREGEPCDRCGTPIRRVAFMNRSSYFCPRCQPVPRARGARSGRDREIDPRPTEVSLLKTAPRSRRVPHVGRLITHGQGSDRPSAARSRPPPPAGRREPQLRIRVAELEALVTRLMEENDRLAVAQAARVSTSSPSTWRCSRPDPPGPGSPHQRHPATTARQQVATPYQRLRTASAPPPLSRFGAPCLANLAAYAGVRVEIRKPPGPPAV